MDLNDRKLLLLGLLRVEEMHGYQLNQFLEEHLDFLTSLKPSTAYYTLEKLAERGLVNTRTEQVGNRPQRQIYEITAAGEAEYQRLLRRNLAQYLPAESADDLGVAFIADLPTDEAIDLLGRKRQAAQTRLARLQTVADQMNNEDATHLSLIRTMRQMENDLRWLDEVEAWVQAHSSASAEI
ncbi:MAG: PadR family transcriptional regulator [Caldilineaceae bacterium]|nr:PadR family transcriptional regulator [Caldilineaceae bacterium]